MDRSRLSPLRRILIPSDGSNFAEQALLYARAIAGADAEYVLVQVVPEADPIFGLLGKRLLTHEQVQHAMVEGARKGLERARTEWIKDCPHVSIEVVEGDYAGEILAVAERRQVDLIVMATHGRGALDRLVIGSVADRVARTSPIPVMLIHPRDEVPPEPSALRFERLIVPLDGSDLAKQALPFAGRIATQLHIPVLLVRVTDLPRELSAVTAYGAAFSPQIYDELLAEGRAEAEQALVDAEAVLSEMGATVSHQLLEGPVVKAIAGVTGAHDVIVMTSHGHGGIRRWFLGSVATKLINQPELAVVLVPSSALS